MAHNPNPNAHRKNNNPMMGRADPTRPLTTTEIRQNELGNRFAQNAALLERNRRVNILARDRHGVEFRVGSPDAPGLGLKDNERERAKHLMNTNTRLQISPATINPTREVSGITKKISKGFEVLDNILNSSTDSLNNQTVRGEVARLSTLAGKAGRTELAGNLDQYLQTFQKNGTLEGAWFGGSMRSLRELQVQIRNEFDVDWLLDQSDGKLLSALPTGYQIGTDGKIYEYANSSQRAAAITERAQDRIDRNRSNMGERNYIDAETFNRMTDARNAALEQQAIDEADYWQAINDAGLPWWAK